MLYAFGALFLVIGFILPFVLPMVLDQKRESARDLNVSQISGMQRVELSSSTIKDINASRLEERSALDIPPPKETFSFWRLLVTPNFIFAGLTGAMGYFQYAFMEPILAPALDNMGCP